MSEADVPRETPSPPDVAGRVFSLDRLPLAVRLWELLADAGVVRGLIGPREVPRLWDRHLLNCAVLADALPAGSSVCDIGSGAGLPGLVLAVRRPDLRLTLVEPLLRRTMFLDEAVEDLGLDNVVVRRGRADDLHGEQTFDVVTSRAVAPLERLLGWSMPLVASEGALVAMKGSSVADEVEEARGALQRWGCAEPEVLTLGAGTVDPPTTALRVAWSDPATVRWPPAPTRDEPRRPARGGPARRRGGRRPR